MDDNKIDLSSVNKKTKKKQALLSLSQLKQSLTKKDAYKRDNEGKFTSGSGGLKKISNFNFRRAAPLIAVIALVGGFFVYHSFAASSTDRVIAWYQACRNSTATNFSGVSYWAGELDSGRATYAKFRDTMKANGDGNCPSSEPAPRSTSSANPTPAATPAPATTTKSPTTSNLSKVILWYQKCRNSTATNFSGASYWAGELDKGTATYAKFRDTMRANKDGNCPDGEPGSATKSSNVQTPPTSGTKPEKKYHQGRSASPDCFSMSNCISVVRNLYKTLLARDPGPDSSGVKDYASRMLDWGWTAAHVKQNIESSSEYKNRQTVVQNAIVDYDPSVTDFMDTRSFLWFAYERLCASGTRSAVNYWTKEIDSGRWTRKAFWDHLQSQQCAENVANERLYTASGQNLTEDGKRAKQIDQQLSKAYWDVFLKMWEQGGWEDWDGTHKPGWMWVLDSGDKHKATQMACEEIVWRYKNGIPAGLDDTCFKLVTGQNKPVHSQDIMYGDYFGDQVTMAEALSRIRAVERGEDQSVSCQSTKAQVLPGCDAGAKYVPLADIEKLLEDSSKQNTNNQSKTSGSGDKKQGTAPSSSPSTPNKPTSNTGSLPTSQPAKTSSDNSTDTSQFGKYLAYVGIENQALEAVVYPECEGVEEAIEPDEVGGCVEYVQNAMALLVDPSTRINGVFDKATQDHLEEFQLSRNIPISEQGKIGQKTFGLIEKALAPRVAKSPYAPPSGMFVNNR